jgi:glycosyltransferase involved in cell wall biosynthesis
MRTPSDRPLHIALWSPAWPLAQYQNGIVTFVHWMRPALEALGHRVSIFTGELGTDVTDSEVHLARRRLWKPVARLLTPKKRSPEEIVFGASGVIAAEMLRVHRRNQIDVIDMEESFGWSADITQRTGIPVVVRLHGPGFLSHSEEELNTDLGRRRIEREGEALRRAQTIVSPCQKTLLQTIERYQISNPEVHHIVNPMSMDEDTPLWRLGDCDRNCILFVGRFDWRKGADVVLQAFRSALRQRPQLRLIFVGPDTGLPSANGTVHFEQYREQIFPPELRDRVEYRGRMPNLEVAQLRTRALVTVIGSRWENQGYTVLEAMFQGCPIVCTDAGGCPENVVHEVTGRLARSEDPESFSTEILAMVNDPAGAERLGQAARRYVLEHHAPSAVATASVRLYRRILSLQESPLASEAANR